MEEDLKTYGHKNNLKWRRKKEGGEKKERSKGYLFIYLAFTSLPAYFAIIIIIIGATMDC